MIRFGGLDVAGGGVGFEVGLNPPSGEGEAFAAPKGEPAVAIRFGGFEVTGGGVGFEAGVGLVIGVVGFDTPGEEDETFAAAAALEGEAFAALPPS